MAAVLSELLEGHERPRMRDVQRRLAEFCHRHGHRQPSRQTIYRFMAQFPPRPYRIADLPRSVQEALYNLDRDGQVPGHQLAFYAFNYGDTRALSFAEGLPWLDLYQADRMRGWRVQSHGILRAVMRTRGI